MLVQAGDYELNFQHPDSPPTLIPSVALEQALDFRNGRAGGSQQNESPGQPTCATCAIHIHGFHLQELRGILNEMQAKISNFDLYITTDTDAKQQAIETMLASHWVGAAAGHWTVLTSSGPGRNISALLLDAYAHLSNYECALHMHTKRSAHTELAEQWRQSLIRNLLGSSQLIEDIRNHFLHEQRLGILIPQICEPMRIYLNWGANFNLAKAIWQHITPNPPLRADAPLVFPAGMMFWFRPQALQPLHRLLMTLQPLPAEPLPLDGSALHALERLVLHGCEISGYQWRMICSEQAHGSRSQSPGSQPLSVLAGQPEIYVQACGLLAQRTRIAEAQLAALGKRPLGFRVTQLIRKIRRLRWN